MEGHLRTLWGNDGNFLAHVTCMELSRVQGDGGEPKNVVEAFSSDRDRENPLFSFPKSHKWDNHKYDPHLFISNIPLIIFVLTPANPIASHSPSPSPFFFTVFASDSFSSSARSVYSRPLILVNASPHMSREAPYCRKESLASPQALSSPPRR